MRILQGSEPRLFSKLVSWVKTNKLLAIGAVLAVCVLIVLTAILIKNLNPSHKIERKIDNLSKATISCKQVISEIGNTNDYEKYSVNAQKRLLEKQMSCFSDQLQLDKAIASGQKLKAIYASEKDSKNQQRVEDLIRNMQSAKASLNGAD